MQSKKGVRTMIHTGAKGMLGHNWFLKLWSIPSLKTDKLGASPFSSVVCS